MNRVTKPGLIALAMLSASSAFSAESGNFWNKELTSLMRESKENTFSNWNYDASIQVGAIGYLDHLTGEFTLISADIVNDPVHFTRKNKDEKWEFLSKGISKNSVEVKIDGGYIDPNTGIKIDVGMEHEWNFSREKSLAVTYIIDKEDYTENPYSLVVDKWDIIEDAAKHTPYIDKETGNISQGFGFISGVKWATRGVAIANDKNQGKYSMTTSVDFFSPQKDKIGIAAKVISEKGSKSVTAINFPSSDKNSQLVPVAFTFTSIEGKRPINDWIQPINQLELIINSKPGSTYITKWKLTYDLISSKEKQFKSGSFPAPQSAAIYLPIDATNVNLAIELPGIFSSNRCSHLWKDPINQWRKGEKQVQTYGVWPANAWCNEIKNN
ncbi:hypothetical protein [Vibrio tasmaniensis]|uniref:hypothetical protein n=1 Tax=Vibrio tasmaniensis TaxID=212663 RepID=UPI001117B71C|nr:hypothetical protein [Vibrio tasmaniensis]